MEQPLVRVFRPIGPEQAKLFGRRMQHVREVAHEKGLQSVRLNDIPKQTLLGADEIIRVLRERHINTGPKTLRTIYDELADIPAYDVAGLRNQISTPARPSIVVAPLSNKKAKQQIALLVPPPYISRKIIAQRTLCQRRVQGLFPDTTFKWNTAFQAGIIAAHVNAQEAPQLEAILRAETHPLAGLFALLGAMVQKVNC